MGKLSQLYENQIRELLTNYGKLDYMFYDFSYGHEDYGWSKGKGKDDWRGDEILELTRSLQTDILVNDRLDLDIGIKTPEMYQPEKPMMDGDESLLWEVCLGMKPTWGYDRDASGWKSTEVLLKLLVDSVSNNGNVLLNIGPTGKGLLDPREEQRFNEIGEWLQLNKRSIIGAYASNYSAPKDCRYTQVGNKLYLHIFSWPLRHIHLKQLAGKIEYAQFLHDHSEIRFKEFNPNQVITTTDTEIDKDTVMLELPVEKQDIIVPVIELTLKNEGGN